MKSNKVAAVDFLQLVTSGKISEAYEEYVDMRGHHHNPHFPGDIRSLKLGMEQNDKVYPDKEYEVKNVLEDGDLIAVHGLVKLSENLKIAGNVKQNFISVIILNMAQLQIGIGRTNPNNLFPLASSYVYRL